MNAWFIAAAALAAWLIVSVGVGLFVGAFIRAGGGPELDDDGLSIFRGEGEL